MASTILNGPTEAAMSIYPNGLIATPNTGVDNPEWPTEAAMSTYLNGPIATAE